MGGARSRYDAKTYDLVAVKLHKEKDKDIILTLKEMTDSGMTKSDAIKTLFRIAIKKQ